MKIAYTSKVSATHEPAPPMNILVADLLVEIDDILDRAGGVGAKVWTLIQKPAELFTVWVKDVAQKKYLDGVSRALDVRRVHRRVAEVVGLHKVWQRRHARCWSCGLPTLGTWVGSDVIECSDESCGAQKSREEYDVHCLELSKDKKK